MFSFFRRKKKDQAKAQEPSDSTTTEKKETPAQTPGGREAEPKAKEPAGAATGAVPGAATGAATPAVAAATAVAPGPSPASAETRSEEERTIAKEEEATHTGRTSPSHKLLEVLEAAGKVERGKIEEYLKKTKSSEAGMRPGRQLSETGLVNEEDMIDAIAANIGMERVSLKNIQVDPNLLALVPIKDARNYRVFPLEMTEDTVTVAVSDPLDVRISDDLKLKLNKNIITKLATEAEIERAIRRHYDAGAVYSVIQDTIDTEVEKRQDLEARGELDEEDEGAHGVIDLDAMDDDSEAAVVKFVNLLFKQAIHDRASDIHIEPTKYSVTIRFRVDGVLHEMPSPPKKWEKQIISRLKVMSRMDLAEKRVPQDGRIQLNVLSKSLDLRVSCLPSIHGESIVMRILDQSSVLLGLADVGFLEDNIALFDRLIRSPNGVILMTGPTGSGKTTTLYAALAALNTPETKIVTIEDPVEYQVQGINQMQVNREIGLDFAQGLRTVLRQSPDVILVGEIRDLETAESATRAALTGHLVFSTLHTNDAPSATIRLIDIGIKPFLVASSVQAIIAQRLVRKICAHCGGPYTPAEEEFRLIGYDPKDYADHVFVAGRGCARCGASGYRGRTAIHEIMVMSPELRQMVIRRESSARIKQTAIRDGMRTLRMDGWEKVLREITTVEEIRRITQHD